MAQSGPVPPAHSRRHRTEHHAIDANNGGGGGGAGVSVAMAAGGRFTDTDWEARDVSRIRIPSKSTHKFSSFSFLLE